MGPGRGKKIDPCPCCKVCENCPGFQKVLDVREAGFVLYRHISFVEEIDKNTSAIRITTNTMDDVFILENTQNAPLENVDFSTELGRNKISCPRCVTIIKHAQRLLQNQELGASDLIGVCEHCRQKSRVERSCLKCNEIVEKFQSSKGAGKTSSHSGRVKKWLSKIQGLIKQALVEDKDKIRGRQISRRHSDIDVNKIFKEVSKTDHEPEIEDLFLHDVRDFYSSKKDPLSDRSYIKKDKGVMFAKTETSYGDRQNVNIRGTPYEETSGAYEDDVLLQSNTTLAEDDIKKVLARRHGKGYNVETVDTDFIPSSLHPFKKGRSKCIDPESGRRLEEEQFQDTRGEYFVSETRPDSLERNVHDGRSYKEEKYGHERQKQYSSEGDTLQAESTKKDAVTAEDKYYESQIKKSIEEGAHSGHDDKRRKVSDPAVGEYHESDKRKIQIGESGFGHGETRKKDLVLSKKYSGDLRRNETETDTVYDERITNEPVPASSKYYDNVKKKDLTKSDSDFESSHRRESVSTSKYDDSEEKRDIPKTHLVSDSRKPREMVPTADNYYDSDGKKDVAAADKYHENDKRKEFIGSDMISDYRKRKETVPTASKYYDSDEKRGTLKAHTVSDDKKRREVVPTTDKYYDRDGKKEVAAADKYQESDRKKELIKSDMGSDQRKRGEAAPTADKYFDSDETKEVAAADKYHESYRKKDINRSDMVSDYKKRGEAVPTANKYFDSDGKKEIAAADKYHESDRRKELIRSDMVSDYRRRKEFISMDEKHQGEIDESGGGRKEYAPAADKVYESQKRKDLMKRAGIHHPEKEAIAQENVKDEAKIKKLIPTEKTDYDEDRQKHITPAAKQDEEDRGHGFVSRIGKRFENNFKKDYREYVSEPEKEIKVFNKFFDPLAVRRKTQDISAMFRPLIRLDEKTKKMKGRDVREMPSSVKKYSSEESLLTGITKVKDIPELAGFDYYFPEIQGEAKKKIKRARSVSSSELIKDTFDKLQLKAEEEKRKREEAERLKEERRKQLEKERKERDLAKKIAHDLEKQLKERQKELELELKAQADANQKELENVEEAKDEVQDKKNDVAKDDDVGSRKKTKPKKAKEDEQDINITENIFKGEKFKQIENKPDKFKEDKEKEIFNKTRENKVKAVENEKDLKSSEKDKEILQQEKKKQSEQDEWEKMKNESSNQREERRKKADEERITQEKAADQPKEVQSEKKVIKQKKETVKPVDIPVDDTKQKETPVAAVKEIVTVNKVKMKIPSIYDLVEQKDRPKEYRKLFDKGNLISATPKDRRLKDATCEVNLSDLDLDLQSLLRKKQQEQNKQKSIKEIIIGEAIYKFISHGHITNTKEEKIGDFKTQDDDKKKVKDGKIRESRPHIIQKQHDKTFGRERDKTKNEPKPVSEPVYAPVSDTKRHEPVPKSVPTKGDKNMFEPDYGKGVVRYTLSDRSFIEKGWTKLPTEKIVRKINVYRMRPSHPEFDWFEHNKNKGELEYDTGEKLAQFDENGRGRLYYKNGNLALDYYNAEEVNAQQRFVIFSSGEPDELGRTHPRTVLATFDYLGNGIVFDHAGKIRLKYNQTEGVILDRSLGPVSHWKWHTLNDPPVLQQVMIDTQMAHKDPHILKLGTPSENKPRPDDEQMLAIEFDNFIKEKSAKLSQSFKPFQIKMKALRINEYFSLRVLDQATVYLIYRDGPKNIKLNIGMILDHKEIVDTDTAEMGEVSNNLERLPARTDSLAELQRNIANAQKKDRSRCERERRIRRPEPRPSADRLAAAASRPLRPPLRTADSASTLGLPNSCCKCRKPTSSNVYYDTSLL